MTRFVIAMVYPFLAVGPTWCIRQTCLSCVSRHRLTSRRRPELRHHALGEEA
jgi:hypothetical protein